MNINLNKIPEENSLRENYRAIIISLIFLTPVLILTGMNVLTISSLVVMSSVPLFFLLIFNFEAILTIFLATMFIDANLLFFSLSEVFSVIVIISFLITHKISFNELKNPFIYPLIIFILSIIPSIITSDITIFSSILSLRLIIFLLLLQCFTIYFDNYSKFKFLFIVFIAFSVINALSLIIESVETNKRAFGFSGIMYVDLVGISLVITTILFLYSNKHRFIYLIITLIFTAALLFTQTRNAWLSSGIIIISIGIQYVIRSIKEKNNFKLILLKGIIFLFPIIFLIYQLTQADFSIFERANFSAYSQTEVTGEYLKTAGSLITRLFIWDTALNAFFANPLTGIGLYTFPFLSFQYSTVDPIVFKLFVELLPPHQAYLAVLCETGLIGFSGFIFFIGAMIFKSGKIIKKAEMKVEKIYSTLIFWLVLYIFISMLMTDAWLWGDLLMLWSVILGMSGANMRIVLRNYY